MTLSHMGDVGDLIACLANFPNLPDKPFDLVLYSAPGRVREPFTPDKVERLRPLLELQPYIRSVTYSNEPQGRILDGWRHYQRHGYNLADMQADYLGLPHADRRTPWLRVDTPQRVASVVIARSPRYHDRSRFPWREALKRYASKAVFVGHPDEHDAFTKAVGTIQYHPTATYLDLARVIAASDLFIGNQSSPFWIATGLMRRTWLEQCNNRQGNCHWIRPGAYHDYQRPYNKA